MTSFYQLMNQLNLANLPIWTISTLKKQPLNPKPALAAHFNPETFNTWFALCSDPQNQLVTLTELYNEPMTPLSLCALRVNIDDQNIMLVDIESVYDETKNQYLKKMPVIYGERSKHGGQHYIVPIPDAVKNDPKYHDLFIKSSVKFGETKEPHSGVEVFFHNHYLTFTQNQIPTKNKNTEQDLRYFLDYLINHVNTHSINAKAYVTNQATIPTDALVIAKHAITKYGDRNIRRFIAKNNEPDESRREYRNLYVIASNIIKTERSHYVNNPFMPGELIDPNSAHDPKMLTWALIHLAYKYLKPRINPNNPTDKSNKWNHIASTNQTYIQYSCNKAITYCLNKHS